MDPSLSLEALAALTDEPVAELRRWQEIGLLPDGDTGLPSAVAERVRLIQFARRRGVTPDEVASVCAEQGDLLASYVAQLPVPVRTSYSDHDQIVEGTHLDPGFVDRIALVAGLREQAGAYPEDLEALHSMTTALELGFPEEAMLQLVRVASASLNRVAEAASRLFHFYVHERMRADGLRGSVLADATNAAAGPLAELLEPMVLYFFRKGWERAMREDLVLHLREEARDPSAVPGELERTILFVDLCGFTPLTDAMGDASAADVLERFSDIVREVATDHDGEIVKQIGDAFMLVFPDAANAVHGAIELSARVDDDPDLPAIRIGVHAGTVLYRDGDYVGGNVNIAARVAASAARHQLLLTGAVRSQLKSDDVELRSLGPSALKGIRGEIELLEVRHDRA
ncbi:MAG TPA: adenylate/guanylate cyclase domain-containing protein [Acidimicrobiia bacterium]|jgi:class 3 adenylate cyclase